MGGAERLYTLFIAEAWLQRGYRAGVVSDSGKLAPLHQPGGSPICTMVEDVLAGGYVVVEHLSGEGFHEGTIGRNITEAERERVEYLESIKHRPLEPLGTYGNHCQCFRCPECPHRSVFYCNACKPGGEED